MRKGFTVLRFPTPSLSILSQTVHCRDSSWYRAKVPQLSSARGHCERHCQQNKTAVAHQSFSTYCQLNMRSFPSGNLRCHVCNIVNQQHSGLGAVTNTLASKDVKLSVIKRLFFNISFCPKCFLWFSQGVVRVSAQGMNGLYCHVPVTHGSLPTGAVITG